MHGSLNRCWKLDLDSGMKVAELPLIYCHLDAQEADVVISVNL